MNIDFINDLIDRLIAAERENHSIDFDWNCDECLYQNGGVFDDESFRIQRLPKLEDDVRRLFANRTSASDFSCQLPYSSCLRLINEQQEDLTWITSDDRSEKETTKTKTFSDLVRLLARRLLPCPFIAIDQDRTKCESRRWLSPEEAHGQSVDRHPNICVPTCVVESGQWFYAILPASDAKDWVTLRDAAIFRPYVLREDSDRLFFVAYQLASTLAYCQTRANFSFTDLRLDSVRINVDDFWCRLDVWRNLRCVAKSLTLVGEESQQPLGVWCDRWTRGLISNFDYLAILNDFAGRRRGDPYYHPIFPWVCDFTCDTSTTGTDGAGWRDLTKTKFRLTKGDQQLEQTFSGPAAGASGGFGVAPDGGRHGSTYRSASISSHTTTSGASLPPHHVTEFLSDIGYYAYKARRTSKSTLCRHVRQRWVPEEYPSSMRRLYEWTPDEAVPELYSDPNLFSTIHEDLLDLELPQWCRGDSPGERFVAWHRAQLESDHVSEHLHSWIDLVFGYQLTGKAAVQAKNVQLRLAERVDRLSNTGVVQLFTKPHPRRQTKNKFSSPQSSTFDDVLNPLYDLERLEKLNLQEDATTPRENSQHLPTDVWRKIRSSQLTGKTCEAVQESLMNLGVFLTELCHSEAFRQLPKYGRAQQRLEISRRVVLNGQSSPLPRCLRSAVEILLTLNLTNSADGMPSPSVDRSILSPELVLQPLIYIIPFPYYLAPMYDCFRRVRSLEMDVANLYFADEGGHVNVQLFLESAEKRVRDVAKLLPLVLPHMPTMGVDLLVRLTKRSLFLDPCTRVLTTWSLWNPLTQALGPDLTEKHLLQCLIDIYDVDSPCSAKFLKLYHRSFLLQLSVRLGMEKFLENFVPPLVEAVAGERDGRFYEDDEAYWKVILDQRSTDHGHGPKRELPNFSSTRDSVSTFETGSTTERHPEQQDDSDSVVQFQLEITDENFIPGRQDSVSVDLDLGGAAVDVVSIRSSESGFSTGAGGPSSFSLSKNDAEDEYGKQNLRRAPSQSYHLSVSEVAEESLLWLAHRLGPLLTTRYLTKNLLRMLALCYSTDRLEPTPSSGDVTRSTIPSWYPVLGDDGANKVLHCLEEIAMIYGEHMILRHYFAYAGELIAQALKRLTPNMEMAVLACVALIGRTFPYLTHEQLMENLKDHTFIDTLLFPLIRAASSMKVTFSNTASRTTLTWKLAECLYWLGVRVGAENVKTYLFVLVQRLFCTYDVLYELESRGNESELKEISRVRSNGDWSDAAFTQLKATFTPVFASKMLKAFGTLCGRQYLQLSLSNSDLLSKLCVDVDSGAPFGASDVGDGTSHDQHRFFPAATVDEAKAIRGVENSEVDLVCKRLKHSSRKLRGTWLAYWEYEIGRNPKEAHFNFKHMKLQTFAGHSGSIKKMCGLDNENSFFSAGQDKTVKLWSLRSTGDGAARTSCQFSYKSHKRPAWDVAFIDAVRLIASTDGSVHIWDPFMGVPIREFEFGDVSTEPQPLQQQVHAATIVQALSPPSNAILVAGTLPVIKFLDVRQAKWSHEFLLSSQANSGPGGPVRALCVDPSGADRWVAVGHGLGHVTVLDLRTGRFLGQSKVCETDIFSMSAFDKDSFIICPFDQPLSLVRAGDCSMFCRLPGSSDGVVCMAPFYQELICATQSSRLRFYASINAQPSFSDSKLRADVFAGAITSICVLPLNRLLLLGSTAGNIELLC